MSIVVKGCRAFVGVYHPPDDRFVDKADRAGIRYHLNSYGILVEFVTRSLFLMSVPLNMNLDHFEQAISVSPVPFEAFPLPKESCDED